MRRLTMCCSLLLLLACVSWSMAGPPVLIDRPSPPPCAADGICYPNVTEWGYYPSRWRRWPGHELVPTPAEPTPEQRLGPDVPPYEIPPPEREDERAPPASTKPPEEAPSGEPGEEPPPADGFDAPTTPGPPGYPAPLESPAEPTTDLDPPPVPPFAGTSAIGSRSAELRRPTNRRPRAARSGPASDPPPQSPWIYRSASLN